MSGERPLPQPGQGSPPPFSDSPWWSVYRQQSWTWGHILFWELGRASRGVSVLVREASVQVCVRDPESGA